ncbi:MAG: phosphoribosylformylglycinamidine cyclo-ligase [Candidatus Goldiibacteriota bacterium]
MKKKYTYKSAGVDIDTAMKSLKMAKNNIKKTFDKNTVTDLGSFGGVYKITDKKFLVASTDGVGTKLKIAQKLKIHDTVGRDIVNHCVDDILVMGAKPLVFLDYIGIGKVTPEVIGGIIKGVTKACIENSTVLIGGETAEMPDVYAKGDYDLVGTIVGEAEKGKVITGKKIKAGDVVIGLGSTGLHTNGYTLARKVFEGNKISYTKYMKELKTTVGKALLKPHKSYLNSVYPLIKKEFSAVHGIAHITGGGFYDNIARVLPGNVKCVIDKRLWKPLPIFGLIQKLGNIDEKEMYRAFNMGIGFVLVVDKKKASSIKAFLKNKKEKVYEIGTIIKGKKGVIVE